MSNDKYQEIAEKIMAQMRAGTAPWVKPWSTMPSPMPVNAATGRRYNGGNVLLLWAEREEKGYETARWMTYKQAQDVGAQVRLGEKHTKVYFVKKIEVKDREAEDEEATKKIGLLREFRVFNIDQMDRVPEKMKGERPQAQNVGERNAAVEAFVKATGAAIIERGERAMYVPSVDQIFMPPFERFRGADHFYATEMHELTHWTGGEKRLDRQLRNRFGTEEYAAEELIAELGSAFLCAELGIDGELQNAAYLDNWMQLLKHDPRAYWTAASAAQKAVDFLRGDVEEMKKAA